MNSKQDVLYWGIINQLVVQENYRILTVSNDHQEIWLEPTTRKKKRVIRILRHDLDWSNWLERDMQVVLQKVDSLRRKTIRRGLEVVNLYISTFPPVDDWEFRTKEPLVAGKNSETKVHSFVIHSENIQQGLSDISHLLQFHPRVDTDKILTEPLLLENLKKEVFTVAQQKVKTEQQLFQYGKPRWTYIFIMIQLGMFFLLEFSGGSQSSQVLMKFGAKYNPSILAGEWWRFFTPIFLHIGFLHLLMNTVALFYLGSAVEKIFGSTRFFIIYMFAGFSGTLLSFALSSSLSAGASGAIFGCFGALLFFGVIHPNLFFRTMGMNILIVIGINLLFGFSIPSIDNAGHIGGLIGGFLAASIVHLPKHKHIVKQTIFLLTTVIFVSVFAYLGFSYPKFDPAVSLSVAQEYIDKEDYEAAYDLLRNTSQDHQYEADQLFLLSYIEIKQGNFDLAKQNLLTVIDIEPLYDEAYFNLALIYTHEGNYEQALELSEDALDIKPNNKDYKELYTQLMNSKESVE
ncbi:rhomboid family intramembrane serine protease [Bacillus sp. SM2101]|uniref:rhomboid family intramembrane serine protease n=1 Tax=Bacillus sp. SM2101 TaxID=2805366 RepID=UPI001BDE9DEE|nr:rhomboid family intramembrane serine protease [Bacillus sp. SM2101]